MGSPMKNCAAQAKERARQQKQTDKAIPGEAGLSGRHGVSPCRNLFKETQGRRQTGKAFQEVTCDRPCGPADGAGLGVSVTQ